MEGTEINMETMEVTIVKIGVITVNNGANIWNKKWKMEIINNNKSLKDKMDFLNFLILMVILQ